MSNFFNHYGDEETLIFVSDADMWADFNGATKTAHGSPTLCERRDTNNPDDNVHTALLSTILNTPLSLSTHLMNIGLVFGDWSSSSRNSQR